MIKTKIITSLVVVFLSFTALSQRTFGQSGDVTSYHSSSAIIRCKTFETILEDRIITITDKEISITNFIGGTKTLRLIVDKIENKEWFLDGICMTYYCTTRDADPIKGYQKAIVYKTYDKIVMGLFADEITVYFSKFNIDL